MSYFSLFTGSVTEIFVCSVVFYLTQVLLSTTKQQNIQSSLHIEFLPGYIMIYCFYLILLSIYGFDEVGMFSQGLQATIVSGENAHV
jgi:hypothetical protein